MSNLLDALNVACQRHFHQSMARWQWNENLQSVTLEYFRPEADRSIIKTYMWGRIAGQWYMVSCAISLEDIHMLPEFQLFNLLDTCISGMVRELNELAADPFELWVRQTRGEVDASPRL